MSRLRRRLFGLLWAALVFLGCGPTTDRRFTTPEVTIETYLTALKKGDRSAVLECFDPPVENFYIPGPMPIGSYRIQRRIVFGTAEVEDWNSKGIVPPAREGDIELEVHRVAYGKPDTFSYNLRKGATGWKIYSHAMWGAPD